jgi:gluconolactonase
VVDPIVMSAGGDPRFDLSETRAYGSDAWLETKLDHPEDVAVTDEGLLFAGGEDGDISRSDPASNDVGVLANTGGSVLGVAIGPQGDLYACDFQRHAVFRLPMDGPEPAGPLERDVAGGPDKPPLHPNYAAFDRDGRLYVSDSGQRDKLPGPFEDSGGCLYVVDPDGTGRVLTEELSAFPNGIALSADGDTLFVCETGTHGIWAVHLEDGHATDVELVTDDCGMVDGLALDAEDRLYIASIGDNAVYRYEDGDIELLVQDEDGLTINNPTNVAFGGRDMQTLYIANLALWHVTAIDIDATGRYPTGRDPPVTD